MYSANRFGDRIQQYVFTWRFYAFFLDLFRPSHLTNRRIRTFVRHEPSHASYTKTAKRIIADFASACLPHRLSDLIRCFYRNGNDNLFHAISVSSPTLYASAVKSSQMRGASEARSEPY